MLQNSLYYPSNSYRTFTSTQIANKTFTSSSSRVEPREAITTMQPPAGGARKVGARAEAQLAGYTAIAAGRPSLKLRLSDKDVFANANP